MDREITVARIYLLEGQDDLNRILDILHDEEKVSGVTVIRGIVGYGRSGDVHTSSLLNLSLRLPLVLEFFDEPDRIRRVIKKLQERLSLEHIVSWPATSHGKDD